MPTLNWIGKEKVVNHHTEVPYRVLEHKYGFDAEQGIIGKKTGSGNKIIHGDNLEALKALLPEYEGKVDCVYIDPPYNTGEENWVYNDNVNEPHIKKWLGEVVGKEREDLSRHDKWICMMYPRLHLINKLLTTNGIVAISISFHEIHSLYFLCKEIFSSKQVVTITLQTSGGKPKDGFNYVHEYIVFVVPKGFAANPLEKAMNDNASAYHAMTLAGFNQETRPNQVYPIYIDKRTGAVKRIGKSLHQLIEEGEYTGEKKDFVFDYVESEDLVSIFPVTQKGDKCAWRLKPNSFKQDWDNGYIKIIPDKSKNNKNMFAVQYLSEGIKKKIESGEIKTSRLSENPDIPTLEVEDFMTAGANISTLWTNKAYYTTKGSDEIVKIFKDKKVFPYPKPKELVKDIIKRVTKENSIILDSFGGSGTTAQAVLEVNKETGGNRKFILIEMMDYANDITAERVKRVVSGYSYQGEKKEEIFSTELTAKNLTQGEELLQEAKAAIEANKDKYDKISQPKVVDNCLKVIGTKVYDGQMPGLGGSFDYYELGDPLFNEDGFLNPNVDESKIKEYIFYTETQTYLKEIPGYEDTYLMGEFNGADYYFYYKRNEITRLNHETLNIVKRKADSYIIYADECQLTKKELSNMNIYFKKIPRDIQKF